MAQLNLKCGNPQQSPTFAFDLETNKLLCLAQFWQDDGDDDDDDDGEEEEEEVEMRVW